MKTALYRHFDETGALLYVGISLSPIHRMLSHERSRWAQTIKTVTIEWFSSRQEARDAELAAILAEGPLHNIDGQPGLPPKMPKPRNAAPPAPAPRINRSRHPPVSYEQMKAAIATIGRRERSSD